jgi:hypothetical protein
MAGREDDPGHAVLVQEPWQLADRALVKIENLGHPPFGEDAFGEVVSHAPHVLHASGEDHGFQFEVFAGRIAQITSGCRLSEEQEQTGKGNCGTQGQTAGRLELGEYHPDGNENRHDQQGLEHLLKGIPWTLLQRMLVEPVFFQHDRSEGNHDGQNPENIAQVRAKRPPRAYPIPGPGLGRQRIADDSG